jgi:flagellar assembly protein FliH
MMISPSEDAGVKTAAHDGVAGLPVRLLNQDLRRKEVSRLEFHSLGQQSAEESAERSSTRMEAEDRLKQEVAALDVRLQSQRDQVSQQIEAARREGALAAREEWEIELADRVAAERAKVSQACEQFGRERTRYFAGVEAEVVKLALAIAERVLHREAKLDPLLLTATVRIALEKVAADSATVLRVSVHELEMWREVFAKEVESIVQLVGDEELGAGECVLDTSVGKVELGVSAQLSEIERGFFDLLQQRPA